MKECNICKKKKKSSKFKHENKKKKKLVFDANLDGKKAF